MAQTDVLLIDACDAARYALRLELRKLGAAVRQARSVEQALPALRARRPDFIIAAPALPGMNALDLLALLRASAGPGAPPVVIHAPAGDWPLAGAALTHGAVAVVGREELMARLPGWLDSPPLPPVPGAAMPARGANPEPARGRRSTPGTAQHRISSPTDPEPRKSSGSTPARCWRHALAGTLLGLLVGLWIASMLQP